MFTVDAESVIKSQWPPDAGRELAEHLFYEQTEWTDIVIDLRELSPAMLIAVSTVDFFNGLPTGTTSSSMTAVRFGG